MIIIHFLLTLDFKFFVHIARDTGLDSARDAIHMIAMEIVMPGCGCDSETEYEDDGDDDDDDDGDSDTDSNSFDDSFGDEFDGNFAAAMRWVWQSYLFF